MQKKIIANIFILIYGLSVTINACNQDHRILVFRLIANISGMPVTLTHKPGIHKKGTNGFIIYTDTSLQKRKITDLTNLDLSYISMRRMYLFNPKTNEQADFSGTDFTGACLYHTMLNGVKLDNAILDYADLRNSHIDYESLSKVASKVGTKFEGAKIYQYLEKTNAIMAYTVVSNSAIDKVLSIIESTKDYVDLINLNNPEIICDILTAINYRAS